MEIIIGLLDVFIVIGIICIIVYMIDYDVEVGSLLSVIGGIGLLLCSYGFFNTIGEKLDVMPYYDITSISISNDKEKPTIYKVIAKKELGGWYISGKTLYIYTTKTSYKLGNQITGNEN